LDIHRPSAAGFFPYVNYDFKMSIGSCQNEKFGHNDAIRSSGGSQASAEDDHYDSALAR
jgi:hypothetical protein